MNMWAGLLGAKPAEHLRAARPPVVDKRFKILEDLLRENGPMDSRDISHRLGWKTAKIREVATKSPNIRACGVTEVPGTVVRDRPVIGLVEDWEKGLNRPQKANPKLAKRMVAAIHAKGDLSYPEMSEALKKAPGLIKDLVHLRPDIFAVVGHRKIESARKVKSMVYELIQPTETP